MLSYNYSFNTFSSHDVVFFIILQFFWVFLSVVLTTLSWISIGSAMGYYYTASKECVPDGESCVGVSRSEFTLIISFSTALSLLLSCNYSRAKFRLHLLHNYYRSNRIHRKLPCCDIVSEILERLEISPGAYFDTSCGFPCLHHRLDNCHALEYCHWYSGQNLLFIWKCNL